MDPPVQRAGPRPRRSAKLAVRITPDALALLDELAAREQRTRSDMVRLLLQRAVQR